MLLSVIVASTILVLGQTPQTNITTAQGTLGDEQASYGIRNGYTHSGCTSTPEVLRLNIAQQRPKIC
jgi:hypothetical protein